jgi:hypothetical protein
MAITGPMQVVYDWSTQRCAPDDFPDMPIRPFRDAQGNVQVNRSRPNNMRFVGPNLNSIKPLCNVTLKSALDSDPSHYNYQTWIQAPYTEDGKTVYAIVHDEHNCQDFGDQNCSYWNMAFAVSTDGGATFHIPTSPGNLVASTPYKYEPGAGMYGLLGGSNIVKGKDGLYYMLVLNKEYKKAEQHTCLLRTNNLSDPSSWRAWDGKGFNMTLIDPYTATGFQPSEHDCPAVDTDIHQLDGMSESLIYDTYLNRYVAVSLNVTFVGNRTVWGIAYDLSDDLIHWDNRKVLIPIELSTFTGAGGPDGAGYAILLDPNSPSRNFETAGKTAYIYFTRFNGYSGISPYDDDLVRFPIEFFRTEQEAQQADVRTKLSLDILADNPGRMLSGTLTNIDGKPIAGASIVLNSSANNDVGTPYDYTVTSTVPQNATSADVGIRINTECNCASNSAADLYLYNFSYTENGGNNRVSNPNFAGGIQPYSSWGSGTLKLLPSDQGAGQMLHVAANHQQNVGLNSAVFPVTPGAKFTYTVHSRVVPGSFWSGFFGLFFLTLKGPESMRITIPFKNPKTQLGDVKTDANGKYEFHWQNVPSSGYRLQAVYAGDAHYWPSNSDGSMDTIP